MPSRCTQLESVQRSSAEEGALSRCAGRNHISNSSADLPSDSLPATGMSTMRAAFLWMHVRSPGFPVRSACKRCTSSVQCSNPLRCYAVYLNTCGCIHICTCTLVYVASHHEVGQKGMGLQGCMKGVTDGQHRGEGYSCPSLSSSLLGWGCWVALAPSPDSKAPSQTGKQANLFPRHCGLHKPICGT